MSTAYIAAYEDDTGPKIEASIGIFPAASYTDIETDTADLVKTSAENFDGGTVKKYKPTITVDNSFRSPNKKKIIEIIKQIWNGTVVDINEELQEITVILQDVTNHSNPDEQVILSMEEIEQRDLQVLEVGSMFLWQIGYRQGEQYPRERFSKIRLRRLIKWTEKELNDAKQQGQNYVDFFFGNSTSST